MLLTSHDLNPLPEIPREKESYGILIGKGFLVTFATLEELDVITRQRKGDFLLRVGKILRKLS